MMLNACILTVSLMTLLATESSAQAISHEHLAKIFSDYTGKGVPGAAVLVIHNGEKVQTGTFGIANLATGEPVRSNTNFRLASVTKQFTAMCILMLVDRGKLRLDASLRSIFPDFPKYADDVTVRHLLTHTSGLLDYEDYVPADSPKQVTDRDVLRIVMGTDHTYFPPGTSFHYSNSGYSILAMIVEERSGLSFAQFLKKNIFDPLGMDGTVAYQKDISEVPHRAMGYTVTKAGVKNTDQSPTSAVLGDGGIYSSIDDLYKWDQALYTDKLVSADLLHAAFTPGLNDYGFGWFIDMFRGHKRYRHTGSTSGFRNFIQRFPNDHLTVIVLTNRAAPDVTPLGEAVVALFISR